MFITSSLLHSVRWPQGPGVTDSRQVAFWHSGVICGEDEAKGSVRSHWAHCGCSPVLLQDLQNLGAQNVCLMTDKNLSLLPPMKAVLESLAKSGVKYKVYDNVRVEPTDTRWDAPTGDLQPGDILRSDWLSGAQLYRSPDTIWRMFNDKRFLVCF